ncbi:MAG: hypothetical protein ACR2GY_05565 [Phycisphaerales bacterium]
MNARHHDKNNAAGESLRSLLSYSLDDIWPFSWLTWFRVPGFSPGPHQIINDADLPAELSSMLRRVVRRTRLWRSERVDVARELIAHFHDGLEQGRSVAELRGRFGDERQTARLIRRARKRNRPIIWQAWRRGWQLVGCLCLVAVIIYTYSAARMWWSSPRISHNYLADLNATALSVPESERAWPHYVNALLAFDADFSEFDGPAHELGAFPGQPLWDEVVELLKRNRDAVEMLRRAAMMDHLGFVAGYQPTGAERTLHRHLSPNTAPPSAMYPDDEDPGLIGVRLTHASKLRIASQILTSDACLAAIEGDRETLLADIDAILNIGMHMREQRLLITELVSISIWYLGYGVIGEALMHDAAIFRDEDLVHLAHRLAALGDGRHLGVRMDSEQLFFLDVLQRTFTDNGHGDGYVTAEGIMKLKDMLTAQSFQHAQSSDALDNLRDALIPFEGILMASREDMLARHRQIMYEVDARLHMPQWQWGDDAASPTLGRMEQSSVTKARYWPLMAILAATDRLAAVGEHQTQIRDALLAAIALELFHRAEGRWPDTLNELVPTWLPSLPHDRFDGQSLRYALRDEGPMLYSIGTDLDDDGGHLPSGAHRSDRASGFGNMMWRSPSDVARLKKSEQNDGSIDGLLPDGDWVLWPMRSNWYAETAGESGDDNALPAER